MDLLAAQSDSIGLPPMLAQALQVEDAQRRWHLLHTRSRQEKALAETLDQLAITCFLPLGREVRHVGKRTFHVDLPLFPSYLFLHGTLDEAYEADRTHRVARIIPVADQKQLRRELSDIARAMTFGVRLDPYPYLGKGVRVEVRSGPFKGLQGLIEGRTNRHRLILQVDVLGQAVSMEIDGALLEPLA